MFESRSQPLISRRRFARRMATFLVVALAIDLAAVLAGGLGFHLAAGVAWGSAFVDSALIITGNGPITPLPTALGRFFAVADALLGGIVFLVVAAVLLSPVIHRVLHAFHLEPDAGRSPAD